MYQRIRDLREDRDLMQKDLAAYLKCTQVCYSNYEMGKRDIPTDVLKALAIYYNTSVDYILGLTDEPKPYPKTLNQPALAEIPPDWFCFYCFSGCVPCIHPIFLYNRK